MKLLEFDTLGSTNTYLKEHYEELDSLTMVSAKTQLKGHGRKERVWESERGNLYCSLLIKDAFFYTHFEEISVVSAYTVLKVLEKHGIKNLSVKWPNDVYVEDRKICGILLEGVYQERMECLIIGIGVNLNQQRFPRFFQNKPTSYCLEKGEFTDVNEFRDELYEALCAHLSDMKEGHSFYHDILPYDYLAGKEVNANIENRKVLVKVHGIQENYTLKAEYNGRDYFLRSGEISFHL